MGFFAEGYSLPPCAVCFVSGFPHDVRFPFIKGQKKWLNSVAFLEDLFLLFCGFLSCRRKWLRLFIKNKNL